MAFTLSGVMNSVHGDKRVQVLRVTADAATGVVTTAMKVVTFAQAQALTGATSVVLMLNANASGVAANGTIGVSATSSGNVVQLVVYGN